MNLLFTCIWSLFSGTEKSGNNEYNIDEQNNVENQIELAKDGQVDYNLFNTNQKDKPSKDDN